MAELATIARPYAEALFKACTAEGADLGTATGWVDELAAIVAHPQLREVAESPKVTTEQVFGVITAVTRSALPPMAGNFLRAVIENGRLRVLPEIAEQFRTLVNETKGSSDAVVVSAFPIDVAALADLGLVLDDIGVNTQLTIKAIDALGNAIDISNAFKTLGQYVTDEKPNFTGFNEIDRTSSTQVVVTNNGTGNAQGRTVFLGDLPTNTASIEITMQSTSNEQLNLALYDMAGSYQTDYIAGGPGIAISSSITSVSDEDDTNIESARIVLTNAKAGDVLNIDNSLLPTGVTAVTDTSTPGQIIINVTGSATKSDYASIIKGITFENTDTSPDATPRVVQVTVNDGDVDSNVAVSTIDVTTGGSLVSSGSADAASADAVPLMTSMNFAQSFSLKQVAALHDHDNDSLNGDSSNAEAPLPALTQLLSTDNTASLGFFDVASTFTAEPVTSVATDTSNVLIPDNLDLYAPLPVVASLDDDQLHSSGHI